MPGTRNLSLLDHRLGLTQVARISEKLRCDPIALIAMTLIDTPAGSTELSAATERHKFAGPARIGTRVRAHPCNKVPHRRQLNARCIKTASEPLFHANSHPFLSQSPKGPLTFPDCANQYLPYNTPYKTGRKASNGRSQVSLDHNQDGDPYPPQVAGKGCGDRPAFRPGWSRRPWSRTL